MEPRLTVNDPDAALDLSPITHELAIELYQRMRLVREFESLVNRQFLQGRIPGTVHLGIGQEAAAVGGVSSLRIDDIAFLTHRGHGQALAKGVSARSLLAELFARETGCCRGFGGSLHVGDMSVGAMPAIGIVGASIPISAGYALAMQRRRQDRVVVCFTGDGAMTEGDAHEGYNLASLWRVPVVYVCENNLYSISTRVDRQARVTSVAERMRAYAIPATTVDGNDVVAVHLAVAAAVALAREGDGPVMVECMTYRQGGHKRDDPGTYRPQAEVDLWIGRDPVLRMRRALEAAGLVARAEEAERLVAATLDEALAFAMASPPATGRVA